jgi:SAM-dependent methyltransferase
VLKIPEEDTLSAHRRILAARPELAAVYRGWFRRLLDSVDGCAPIVEIGAGPGLLKAEAPAVISTDVMVLPWVDVACDATTLPFRDGSVGALVMVDVLHHLPRPVQFLQEAARVLRRGGRIAMIEPWVSPLSYVLYRFFHHETCDLSVDLALPFGETTKQYMDGNAAIPRKVLKSLEHLPVPFRLVTMEPFLALPYLATLGFKTSRRMPDGLIAFAGQLERAAGFLRPAAATRVMAVLERTDERPPDAK